MTRCVFGPDGDTKAQRTASILPILFELQRAAVNSAQAMETARRLVRDAITVLAAIEPDLVEPTLPAHTNTSQEITSQVPHAAAANTSQEDGNNPEEDTHSAATDTTDPCSAPLRQTTDEGVNISAQAPPISTTKGSRKNRSEDAPEPHFQRPKKKQKRRCSKCGGLATGHNAATCDRANSIAAEGVTKRPRGRPKGSGNKKEREREIESES